MKKILLFIFIFFISCKAGSAVAASCGSGYSCTGSCVVSQFGTYCYCPNGGATNNQQCASVGGAGGTYNNVACCTYPQYDCGLNTPINTYCHTGPSCGYGYHYTNLWTCNPALFDGCCAECPAAQTCNASVAGGSIPNGNCGWTLCPVACTSYTCGAWSNPYSCATNTCSTGNCTENRYCTWDLPSGCRNYSNSNFYQYRNVTVDNCYNGYACTGGTCLGTINVHVYIDYGHDGGNDANYPSGVVTINGGQATTTGADGTVTYQKPTGTYTIAYSDNSPDYQPTGATSQNVTLNAGTSNVTVNFRVTPLYSISGNIFNDTNKNTKHDGPDTLYTGTSTIHFANGPTSVADINTSNGTYATAETLLSGTYTVSQTHSLGAGYNYTTASTWSVTVGNPAGSPACNKSTSPDASCTNPNAGSIANLNFGVNNNNPWNQSVCFDIRNDSGTYSNQIPAAPSCGGVTGAYDTVTNASCTTGAGIVFTCDATPDFGLGSANANNWQAGGAGTQAECFTGAGLNVIRTSYDYLLTTARQSGITPLDMATVCGAGGLANCTLSASLAKGVYQANGDVHLNGYTFPVDANNPQSFIFLINGNLYIGGNILIPAGSVAAFSTSGNIYVDASVGNTITDPNSTAVNNPNIEGLYSTDANFIVQSNGSVGNYCNADGTPKDKKLNIVGSIVVNASQAGGTYTDNRDLCIYDAYCSTVTLGDGDGTSDKGLALSYIMTLFADGKFLNHKLFNWQELRP